MVTTSSDITYAIEGTTCLIVALSPLARRILRPVAEGSRLSIEDWEWIERRASLGGLRVEPR